MRNTFFFLWNSIQGYAPIILHICDESDATKKHDFRVATMKMLRRHSPTNYENLVHLS